MRINLLDYFEETTLRVEDKTAVIDGDRQLSFVELKQCAERLGVEIVKSIGDMQNRPIAVFLPKSLESVYSDLGIMYSCNIYLNLDVKSPAARLQAIMDIINPVLVISLRKYQQAIEEMSINVPVLYLDDIENDAVCSEETIRLKEIRKTLIDTDPLCIINTSGSTGTPKGVVLNHRSFIDFVEWAIEEAGIRDDEIMGCLSPIVFDIYSFELCVLMAKGGTMVLMPDSAAAFPARMLQLMIDTQVNFIFWVPTIMCNIANMGLLEKLPLRSLRTVWFAGEVFPTKQFNIWRKNLPSAKFINLYGPIEITLDCTYYIVEREFADNEVLPIGYACKNTQILLLNEKDQLCSEGEEGEICVRGTSLAMGYYNNPEKTSLAFVQNPLNHSYPELIYRTGDIGIVNEYGEIVFKGRKDTLVKHLGYRIELGEIEHIIINTLKLVKNGCVVYNASEKEIVFYYEEEEEIDVTVFRKELAKILPKYMIPTRYVYMSALPRNTNGKIDRLLLKKQTEE